MTSRIEEKELLVPADFDLFREVHSYYNFMVLINPRAGNTVWVNNLVIHNHLSNHALIRIIDTGSLFEKPSDSMNGISLNLPCAFPLPLNISDNELVTFDLSDLVLPDLLLEKKLCVMNTIAQDLRSTSDRLKIIIFDNLPEFIKDGGDTLLDIIKRVCREAKSYNGMIFAHAYSPGDVEKLGGLGTAVANLFDAIYAVRQPLEEMETLERMGISGHFRQPKA
jgi:hypothetical protein